jgi:hypothetical protein
MKTLKTTLPRLLVCGLVAVSVSACANLSKPYDGGVKDGKLVSRGKLDDPRIVHYKCLKAHHLLVSEPSVTEIQVGRPGVGPLIRFLATPGFAQATQISGQAQAAEIIGSAQLYPNQASDAELTVVEACTALGVTG